MSVLTRKSLPSLYNGGFLVQELKTNALNMLDQKTALQSKVFQMKNRIEGRKTVLSKILNKSTSSRIPLDSDVNITYLKKELETLKKIKTSKERELMEILKNDRYWRAKELKSEILVLHQEESRIKNEYSGISRATREIIDQLNQLESFIANSRLNIHDIKAIQSDIDKEKESIQIYIKGTETQMQNALMWMSSTKYEDEKRIITEDIQRISDETNNMKIESEQCIQDQITSVRELDIIIQEMLVKVKEVSQDYY